MSSQGAVWERALLAAILERLAAITAQPVWPEFRPAALPLAVAIRDAGSTWRLSPPDSARSPGTTIEVVAGQTVMRLPQIDPRIVANSVADFDGVPAATVIVPPGAMTPDVDDGWNRYVGIAAHELFHVHQAEMGFAPGGNEAVLLTLSRNDPCRLAMARAEWSALRRAVETREAAPPGSTVREAIALRRERIKQLSAEELAYVRATELKEGTARYVEARTRGSSPPDADFWMDEAGLELRYRCYDTGMAWCLLLNRFGPDDWKAPIAAHAGDGWSLDEMAMATLPDRGEASEAPASWEDLVPTTTDDIARERSRRAELVASLRSPGKTRVVVSAAPGLDLLVEGFDPLNVLSLDSATVLHERYLALAAGDTTLTILDRPAITTSSSNGDHPLFAGLREAEVFGDVNVSLVLPATGLRIEGPHHITEGTDGVVTIVLGAPVP